MKTPSGHTRQLFPSSPRRLNHACQNPGEGSLTVNSRRTRRRHTFQHPPSSHSQNSRSRFKVSLQIRQLVYRFRLPHTSGMWLVLFKLGQHCQQQYGPQSTQAEDYFPSIPYPYPKSSPPGLHFSFPIDSFSSTLPEITRTYNSRVIGITQLLPSSN